MFSANLNIKFVIETRVLTTADHFAKILHLASNWAIKLAKLQVLNFRSFLCVITVDILIHVTIRLMSFFIFNHIMPLTRFPEILTKHEFILATAKDTIKNYMIIISLLSVYPYTCAGKVRNKIAQINHQIKKCFVEMQCLICHLLYV